jgi:hypothetical protein
VSRGDAPALVDGVPVAVTLSISRCANPACLTALELAVLATAGYVPELVQQHRLTTATPRASPPAATPPPASGWTPPASRARRPRSGSCSES